MASNSLAKIASTSKANVAMEDRWRAEDDLRTLQNAAEIRRDSGRMAAIRKLVEQQEAVIGDTD